MGGNDSIYADGVEKRMDGKNEVTSFVPWYVNRVNLIHILEKRGYTVKDDGNVLTVKRNG